jgi:hypothetical protein
VIIVGGGRLARPFARLLLDDDDGGGSNGLVLEQRHHHQCRPLRVALLERRPALPWLRDLVDGNVDIGGDGDGTSTFALNCHLR